MYCTVISYTNKSVRSQWDLWNFDQSKLYKQIGEVSMGSLELTLVNFYLGCIEEKIFSYLT